MKLPIKKNRKKYKQYNRNGLDRGTSLNTNVLLTSYGRTPQIDLSLPTNHPANIRAAIAQQKGWVEVPISEIDIDVNKKYRQSIDEDLVKYGPNAKYIVDPKSREIIPDKVFDDLLTQLGFLNTSGAILDANTAFKILQAQNHRDLLKRDPQGLAYVTLGAGALTNPVTATALGYLGQAKYAYDGYQDAYLSFLLGDYGKGLLKAGTTTALAGIPYGKALSYLKYAPKVGIPLAMGLTAADMYASNTEPHTFTSTLSPEDKAMIDNESTPWEEIGNDEEQRLRWSKLMEDELAAAHFTYSEGKDSYGQMAKVVWGNKGENTEQTNNNNKTPWYKDPWLYTRYVGPPLAIEGIPRLAKALLQRNIPWANVARMLGWAGYGYLNVAYDTGIWPFLNTGTEASPDGYDENLALYYLKLIRAYLRLNSGQYNGYVNGSTFSPYQTYPKRKNYDWNEGKPFDAPDTNAIVVKTGRLADTTNVNSDKSSDSLTNIISNIQVPQ